MKLIIEREATFENNSDIIFSLNLVILISNFSKQQLLWLQASGDS